MVFLGLALYIFWLLITLLKINSLAQTPTFSYQVVFFGSLSWYKNARNIILLVSFCILIYFASLQFIYFLFLFSSLFFLVLFIHNIQRSIGTVKENLILMSLSILVSVISCWILSLL